METTDRPDTGGRLMLCADAFLYTGALTMLLMGGSALVATAASADPETIPEWVQLAGPLSMLISLAGGVLLAWRFHRRELHGITWLGMIAGIVIGGPVGIAAFFALFSLGQYIPNPFATEGPWGLVIVVVVAVIAFLVMPIIDAIRDLGATRRVHVKLDWMRFGAFAVTAAMVAATTVVGIQQQSEVGEAGMFMVPVAASAALAVLGADLVESWRTRKHAVAEAPQA